MRTAVSLGPARFASRTETHPIGLNSFQNFLRSYDLAIWRFAKFAFTNRKWKSEAQHYYTKTLGPQQLFIVFEENAIFRDSPRGAGAISRRQLPLHY